MEEIAAAEEKKLELAEQYLEEDAAMFDEFLKENDKNSVTDTAEIEPEDEIKSEDEIENEDVVEHQQSEVSILIMRCSVQCHLVVELISPPW